MTTTQYRNPAQTDTDGYDVELDADAETDAAWWAAEWKRICGRRKRFARNTRRRLSKVWPWIPGQVAEPLYTVGTMHNNEFRPNPWLNVPSVNVPLATLREVLRQLKRRYSCHRRRGPDGEYDDNDSEVKVERTDGGYPDDIYITKRDMREQADLRRRQASAA